MLCVGVTLGLALRKELSLRVFEKRFEEVFVPKRNEVTGNWRKLRNEAFNDLQSSPNILRVIKSRRLK
jgi:hypothetical protein